MNEKITFLALLTLLTSVTVFSQTSFFEQNFESTSPITNFRNSDGGGNFTEATLLEGASQCGYGSKADASTHSGGNISFHATENSTYFFGMNPEDPCGGYTNCYPQSAAFDLSGQTTGAYFSFKYLITTTSPFGPTSVTIEIKNSSSTFTTLTSDADLTVRNQWTNFETQLPTSANVSNVYISISMVGGNGFGIDDIVVSDQATLAVKNYNASNFSMYPNPVSDKLFIKGSATISAVKIYNIQGQLVESSDSFKDYINVEELKSGLYLVEIQSDKDESFKKVLISHNQ